MYIELIHPVDDIRLGPRAPAGMVTAVPDGFGRKLVKAAQAVELTLEEFRRRLEEESWRTAKARVIC